MFATNLNLRNSIQGMTLLEGGPGSGTDEDNTKPIDLPMSEFVSVGTRKGIMDNMPYTEKTIPMKEITKVGQKGYVPKKVESLMANKEFIKSSSIAVLHVPGDGYHVMDGHHRYMAAARLNMDKISARVYEKSEMTMPKKQESRAYFEDDDLDGDMVDGTCNVEKSTAPPPKMKQVTGRISRKDFFTTSELLRAGYNLRMKMIDMNALASDMGPLQRKRYHQHINTIANKTSVGDEDYDCAVRWVKKIHENHDAEQIMEDAYWQSMDAQRECFAYHGLEFDIEEAKRLSSGAKIYKVKPNPDWNLEARIDPVYVAKADLNRPIIFASVLEDGIPGVILIDGHHRVEKALQCGVGELPAVTLTIEQAASIVENKKPGVELGKKAFAKGINSPAEDPEVMKLIQGKKPGDKETAKLFKDWQKGWAMANLKA